MNVFKRALSLLSHECFDISAFQISCFKNVLLPGIKEILFPVTRIIRQHGQPIVVTEQSHYAESSKHLLICKRYAAEDWEKHSFPDHPVPWSGVSFA